MTKLTTASTANVDDLAAIVRRLVRALKKANVNSDLQAQALDYLSRNGLKAEILRQMSCPN